MSNDKLFKALSSTTRLQILKILLEEELHLSAVAKKIGISKPVVSRHIKKLEEADLINIRKIGNMYLLKTKTNNLEKIFESFIQEKTINVEKEENIFEILKQVPGIQVKKIDNNQYITSIDGEEGYYIYEVNGKLPSIPIEKYKIEKNITIDLKKIVSINKKKVNVNLKK